MNRAVLSGELARKLDGGATLSRGRHLRSAFPENGMGCVLLRVGRRRCALTGTRSVATMSSAALVAHHLFKLGLLIGVQNGFDLAGRCLADLLYFRHPVLLRQRGVTTQLLHLLRFAFQDGLDLRLLLASEVELLGHALQPLFGRRRLPVPAIRATTLSRIRRSLREPQRFRQAPRPKPVQHE